MQGGTALRPRSRNKAVSAARAIRIIGSSCGLEASNLFALDNQQPNLVLSLFPETPPLQRSIHLPLNPRAPRGISLPANPCQPSEPRPSGGPPDHLLRLSPRGRSPAISSSTCTPSHAGRSPTASQGSPFLRTSWPPAYLYSGNGRRGALVTPLPTGYCVPGRIGGPAWPPGLSNSVS